MVKFNFFRKVKNNVATITAAAFLAVVLSCYWSPGLIAASKPTINEKANTIDKTADRSTGTFEKETTPAIAKKKHFPWLLVAAGAVGVGVLVYFLFIKKPNFQLRIDVDANVTGEPGSNIKYYKKGKTIDYSYSVKPGFANLQVLLDGVQVPASGTFRMDKDHSLKATAQEIHYTLTVTTGTGVTGSPAAGTSTRRWQESVAYSYSAAVGYKNLKVLLDNAEVPAQGTVTMDRDHTLNVTAEKILDDERIVNIGGQWNFTYTSPKKGTINTVAIFSPSSPPDPRISSGHVTIQGDWQGHFILEDGIRITLSFGPYPENHEFSGTLSDNNHMSGQYRLFLGDPPSLDDSGTWSAVRIGGSGQTKR